MIEFDNHYPPNEPVSPERFEERLEGLKKFFPSLYEGVKHADYLLTEVDSEGLNSFRYGGNRFYLGDGLSCFVSLDRGFDPTNSLLSLNFMQKVDDDIDTTDYRLRLPTDDPSYDFHGKSPFYRYEYDPETNRMMHEISENEAEMVMGILKSITPDQARVRGAYEKSTG